MLTSVITAGRTTEEQPFVAMSSKCVQNAIPFIVKLQSQLLKLRMLPRIRLERLEQITKRGNLTANEISGDAQ